ncbi:Transposase zinc-binding domain-containing protein [Bosea sp. CRIB-10]|uniref:IS91 family transposase n=1 Tax=Bosea sp. CRIB-10 TaxID=378404 RepID=UPI0008DF1EA5|nr:IS91 family transposase [Bosea sp. CRIB-10]SFD51358.1 Transposase zinc-binding domain-containing protein [Bosea sp. CRIB-10]
MARPSLEVADILNRHGETYLARHRLSRGQLKVMGAIRACRTAALGGHVMACGDCDHATIAYNSCRNRHCPRCQGAAAKDWLADRQADLLPVPYYHLVFTLPAPIAAIAFQNKAEVYGLLFRAAAETLATIASDTRHLGARIGFTSVLHTWGSAMTHHPHLHVIAPGGGLSPDGAHWIACRPGFFLPIRVLSRLFRRLFLAGLTALHVAGQLAFHGELGHLTEADAFAAMLVPLRRVDWVVYAKRPFGGPDAVLAYLARYTHRVAIANSRLVAMDQRGVTFHWKDYRARSVGKTWRKTMTLTAYAFIRRFLLHVLPDGFHRIRHYGLLASSRRAGIIARIRQIIAATTPAAAPQEQDADGRSGTDEPRDDHRPPCPCCGGRMIIVERFAPGAAPRTIVAVRIDTS